MFFTIDKNPKKVKFALLAFVLISVGIILAIFIGYRRNLNKHERFIPPIKSKSTISIGKVQQTSTKNGTKEWNMDASSACYIDEKKQAIFQDLSVTFFLNADKKVYLTANQGVLKTDSNNLEVSGNVVVKNENYRLITESLHYDRNKQILFSKVPIKITGSSSSLEAESMSFDLNTNKALFHGKVAADFDEKITL